MSDKVFTSSIVPPGQKLIGVRDGNPTISTVYIEFFEVFFGMLIIAFILGRQYKATIKKKEEITDGHRKAMSQAACEYQSETEGVSKRAYD